MFKPEVSDLLILLVPLSSSAEKRSVHVETELTFILQRPRFRDSVSSEMMCVSMQAGI